MLQNLFVLSDYAKQADCPQKVGNMLVYLSFCIVDRGKFDGVFKGDV